MSTDERLRSLLERGLSVMEAGLHLNWCHAGLTDDAEQWTVDVIAALAPTPAVNEPELAAGYRASAAADSQIAEEFAGTSHVFSPDNVTCGPAAAPAPASERERLTFTEFSKANRLRCESKDGFNHRLTSWSTSDWFTAVVGELGEAANVAKKLNRVRDRIPGNKQTPEQLKGELRKELGDVFVYLDLLAQSLDFQISDAAVEVFNAKSEELNFPIRLLTPQEPAKDGLVEP